MLKRSLLLGLLLAVLILPGLTMTCAAQDVIIESDTSVEFQDCMAALQNASDGSIVSTRGATIAQVMEVPYNIMSGNWITGLNVHSLNDNEELTFFYVNKGVPYKSFTIVMKKNMTDSTFVINSEVLMGSTPFKSPTTLLIGSIKGGFTLSQFLMNGDEGFGYQTFNSK